MHSMEFAIKSLKSHYHDSYNTRVCIVIRTYKMLHIHMYSDTRVRVETIGSGII